MNDSRKLTVSDLMTISYMACIGFLNAPYGSESVTAYYKVLWDAKMRMVALVGKRGFVYSQNAWCLALRKHNRDRGIENQYSPNFYIKEREQAVF